VRARLLASTAAALLASAALAAAAASARAAPPRPENLTVAGGAEAWHADTGFSLSWSAPAGVPVPTTAGYRVRDSEGRVVGERRVAWFAGRVYPVTVPRIPDAYATEVWFEDDVGEAGPPAVTTLRFDDRAPGPVAPEAPPGWIGRADFPLRVRMEHPATPWPRAGIRGYAATVDGLRNGSPCAAAGRCSEAETTLPGGAGDDVFEIPSLPEGTSYLHAVAVSGAGVSSAAAGQATLRVDLTDPVTRLAGALAGWTNRPVPLVARASDAGAGMAAAGALGPFTAIAIDGRAPAVATGDTVAADAIGEGEHLVAYYARDAAGNVADGSAAGGAPGHPPAAAWVGIDRAAPTVAFANAQDPRDPEAIEARVSDALSGPDLPRGGIGVRRAGSGDRFAPLPVERRGDGGLTARWDSDSYPHGEYEFEAVGYDAAGNRATGDRRANGERMVLANPLKATTKLRCAFARRGVRRSAPYGRRAPVRGRLVTGLSSPLAGAPLRVVERFAAGARPATRVSTVATDAAGRFAFRLGPGPSRTIELAYEGGRTMARASGRTLRLDVRGRVALRTSSRSARVGGRPLVFRGRVAATPGTIPAKGMPVQLQFRLGRRPWSAFRTVQADALGRFRYAYRFADDDSRGARFQFRAYVPAHEDWPYEPAGSRPVLVRGY